MVGDRFSRNYEFLRTLATTKSQNKRLYLLQNATVDQVMAVVDAAANIALYKTFCINKHEMKKLMPYKKHVVKLSTAVNPQMAKQFLIQKGRGSFLPALLVPVLIEVARLLFKK